MPDEIVDPATIPEKEAVTEESTTSDETTGGKAEETHEEIEQVEEQTPEQLEAANKALTAELIKTRREKANARTERDQVKAEAERKAVEATTQPLVRPNRDDFDTEEGYEDAVADHRFGVREQESKKASAEANVKAEKDRVQETYDSGMDAAHEKHEGFDDLITIASEACSPSFGYKVRSCENAHDIVAHFGNNPDEARRISKLSDLQQGMELGVLASKLASSVTQKTKTKATPPGKPLGGTGATGGAAGKLTTTEWIAKRNAEEEAKGAA